MTTETHVTSNPSDVIRAAFANAGVNENDLVKVDALCNGPSAPLRTAWPDVLVADLNTVAQELDIPNLRLHGYLKLGQNRTDLRPDGSQHLFLVGVKRLASSVGVDGVPATPFVSYSLVCPETMGNKCLVVALALIFNGSRYSLAPSARLYLQNSNDGTPVVDATATIENLSTAIAVAMSAIVKHGMPYRNTPVTQQRSRITTPQNQEAMDILSAAQKSVVEIPFDPFRSKK